MTEKKWELDIEKKWGKGASFKLGDKKALSIPAIPTGSYRLDEALGIGGIPLGRIVEVYGPESSGKSTLIQCIIGQIQKMGGTCAFVDAEHSLDPEWAEKCGVDVDALYVSQMDSGEANLDLVEAYIRSGDIDFVAVDSVAALVPRAEIEGEMGDTHMALQARLMSQALRKLSHPIEEHNCTVMFSNQLRSKIGVMFGSPETTTGGNALKFWASVRIDLRRRETLKDGNIAVGNTVKATIKKNKVAPPYRVTEFDIDFENGGIDTAAEIMYYLVDSGLIKHGITKAGSYYTIDIDGFQDKVQGKENFKALIRSNPALMAGLENVIREHLRLPHKEIIND